MVQFSPKALPLSDEKNKNIVSTWALELLFVHKYIFVMLLMYNKEMFVYYW